MPQALSAESIIKHLPILIAITLCVLPSSQTQAAEQDEYIGYVRINEWNVPPSQVYTITRDGQNMTELYQDMPVKKGDLITPHKGHEVLLRFTVVQCPSKATISSPTMVSCDQENKDSVISLIQDKVIIRHLEEERAVTTGIHMDIKNTEISN